MKLTHTAPLLFPHLSLHCVYITDLACSYTWELLTSRRKIEWESWLLLEGVWNASPPRHQILCLPLPVVDTTYRVPQQNWDYQIKHLQIGFPPCYGQPVSISCVLFVSHQDYAEISIPKSCLLQSLASQHPILVMIFGAENGLPCGSKLGSKIIIHIGYWECSISLGLSKKQKKFLEPITGGIPICSFQ